LAGGESVITIASTVVQFGLTLGGDVASFQTQKAALTTTIATTVGCAPPDCSLELRVAAAGSVNIDVIMVIPDGGVNAAAIVAAVESASSTLVSSGVAAISSTLGVTVMSSSAPTKATGVSVALVVAPPPPFPASDLSTGAIAGAAAGGSIALVVIILVVWKCMTKRTPATATALKSGSV